MDFMFFLEHSGKDWTLSCFRDASYSDKEAYQLIEGGFRIIPIEALLKDERFLSLRYTGDFNLFSADAKWDLLREEFSKPIPSYFICDAYYRRFFQPLPLNAFSIYGDQGIEWGPPEVGLDKTAFARIHHREVPAFIAYSVDTSRRSLTPYKSTILNLLTCFVVKPKSTRSLGQQ